MSRVPPHPRRKADIHHVKPELIDSTIELNTDVCANIVRENKWCAALWEPDSDLIVDEEGRLEPLAESIGRLIESLEPVSKRPGSHAELMRVPEVMRTGPSYARQRQVYADTGDFPRVVQSFVTELRDSVPGVARPDPLRLSGVATNLPSAKPGAVPTR